VRDHPKRSPRCTDVEHFRPSKILQYSCMAALILSRRATYKTSSSCRVPSPSYPTLYSRSTKSSKYEFYGLLLFSKSHYDQTDVRATRRSFPKNTRTSKNVRRGLDQFIKHNHQNSHTFRSMCCLSFSSFHTKPSASSTYVSSIATSQKH